MNLTYLHPEEQALLVTIRPWLDRARDMVDRRFADAHSHAAAGRIPDALARLDELTRALSGYLSDARGTFYRDAYRWHRQRLDPAIHQMDAQPSIDGEYMARVVKIGGRDAYKDLRRLVDRAKMALGVAASAAGDARVGGNLGESILSAWEVTHREDVYQFARVTLSDSQMALHNAVGHVLIKPELR